jgi:hypothetical protein
MPEETALVVLVPEAEPAVAALRAAHDSSAALGVPAHLTVLYPFVPEAAWTEATGAQVAAIARSVAPCDVSFRRTGRFGDAVLYLVPEPDAPFRALTRAIHAAFPAHPPYGGAHGEPTPHLTVADQGGAQVLDACVRALAGTPPIRTRVAQLALLVQRHGRWRFREQWPLGAAPPTGPG